MRLRPTLEILRSPLLSLTACAIVGCGTPAALPDGVPRGEVRLCFSEEAEESVPAGGVDVVQVAFPGLSAARAQDLERLIRLALAEASWSGLAGVTYYGDQFSVAQTPRLRERAQSLLWAVQRAGRQRVGATLTIYELPWETVDSLGSLTQARGASEGSPLLAVPISKEVGRHLEALEVEGGSQLVGQMQVAGLAAQWLAGSEEHKRAYIAGLELRSDPRLSVIASPNVATARSGTVAELSCLPVEDGLLLGFEIKDTLVTWTDPLQATHGPFTRVPVSLPTKTVRKAADVARLRAGEQLALVGTSARPEFARVILLRPEVFGGFVVRGLDLRDPPLVPPRLPIVGED